jgi:hypothetical protein
MVVGNSVTRNVIFKCYVDDNDVEIMKVMTIFVMG